jgi:cysteine-rich repeat protein
VLDDGEACDDGNEVDGDGCNVDCIESGTPLETFEYDTPAHEHDVGRGVKVTPDGDFVVVGNVFRSDLEQASDGWIRKYTEDGEEVWTDTYDNPIANDNDVYFGVDVHADGRIAVSGYERRADISQSEDLLLVVYDGDGNREWIVTHDHPQDHLADWGYGTGFDANGNVYVGGFEGRSSTNGYPDAWTAKYSPAGVEQWVRSYNNEGNTNEYCREFRTDSAGNSVCVGSEYREDQGQSHNGLVIKRTPNGDVSWMDTHNSNADEADAFLAVDASEQGEVLVAGYETRSDLGQGENIIVRMYDEDGGELWTEREDGPASSNDRAEAAVIDGAGNAIVVGRVAMDVAGDLAIWVRKYGPSGNELWTDVDNLSSGDDGAQGVDVWPDGRIVVVGHIDATEEDEDTNIWIRIYAP